MQKFKVYWKGDFVGEFTADELRGEVARGTIGHLHGVMLKSGRFASVGDVLQSVGESGGEEFDLEAELNRTDAAKAENEFDFLIFGCVLAGLSFLSLAATIGAAAYCLFLAKSGRGKLATQIMLLALCIGALGFFFNSYVLSAI